jgi:hypothetical protein
MVLGLAAMLFARRRAGFLHMARGTIGALGLLLATTPIYSVFHAHAEIWPTVAAQIAEKRVGPAIELVLSHLGNAPYVMAGLFLLSVVLLSWPERRLPTTTPAPQGAA